MSRTLRSRGPITPLHLIRTVVPFGAREWRAAVAAFLRFGRGHHEAALNFGDCLAYAAATVANDSLLFVGGDFALTDITPA